jgi:glutamine synthetase
VTPDDLAQAVATDDIDTVVVGFTDHYGRLMGKRFDAAFFLESGLHEGTHACDYLLTVDMDMEPVEGFAFANWDGGYGDFHLVPDATTLRRAAWTDRTALVLCDVESNATHEPIAVAPRTMLRRQADRLADAGFTAAGASELEFFLYRDSYRDAHTKGYDNLETAGWYVEDYNLLQGARTEDYVGAARRALSASDIPVENSKGEAATGQHELNIRYADVLVMADRHVVMKQAMKELADSQGVAVSFMAKPHGDRPGSSCHLHLSLWRDGQNAFTSPDGSESDVFRWFLAGWMKHTAELLPFYAPTINSYKRYQHQSWAPTRLGWSHDNRTTSFRVVGQDQSRRIECRLPGADTNPYLAFAAALASGLDGVDQQLEPPAELIGDGYISDATPIDTTLRAATARFSESDAARTFFGEDVVDHYHHHFSAEVRAAEAAVTDWERRRYFEQI